MRHRSCIEAEGGSHAETCQVVLDEFLTFNPTTLTSSRCQLCQQFFLTSTCRKLSSPHAVSEKNPYNLLQIATKLQRPGLQTIKQKKQWAVWKKKTSKQSLKSFHIKNMGMNRFFPWKKNECSLFLSSIFFYQVDLHHLGCQHPQVSSGQYGRHWCLPIHSWKNVENKQTPVEGEMTLNTDCFRFGDPYSSLIRRPGSACTVFFSYVASKICHKIQNPKSKIPKLQNPKSKIHKI